MSRTDKDMPDWVTAEWWRPMHWCGTNRACDLPADPPYRHPTKPTWRGRYHCFWWPVYERSPWRHPSHDVVRAYGTGPQRRRVRDALRRAAAEYRATGQVDVDVPIDQHRHGVCWLWA